MTKIATRCDFELRMQTCLYALKIYSKQHYYEFCQVIQENSMDSYEWESYWGSRYKRRHQ